MQEWAATHPNELATRLVIFGQRLMAPAWETGQEFLPIDLPFCTMLELMLIKTSNQFPDLGRGEIPIYQAQKWLPIQMYNELR